MGITRPTCVSPHRAKFPDLGRGFSVVCEILKMLAMFLVDSKIFFVTPPHDHRDVTACSFKFHCPTMITEQDLRSRTLTAFFEGIMRSLVGPHFYHQDKRLGL